MPFVRVPVAMTCVVALVACGSSANTDARKVKTAQARVSSAEKDVADAQSTFDNAAKSFCQNTHSYIAAIDRYGKVFDQSAATVGDVKAAGTDLVKPRETVTTSVQAVTDARNGVATAQHDLADAKASLAAAEAKAAGSSVPSSGSASTTTTTVVPKATVDRVERAEADFASASQGITDQTPILNATATFNSAAFALEIAWLRALADAGCLTDEQHQQAEAALTEYTTALQNALTTTNYYTGEVDGVYGPSTLDAVKKLQTANGLTPTGYVDRATAAALSAAMAVKGGDVATRALAHTAAVQATLKLAGFWTGPVDGHWTPELTTALKAFQTHLGVPATGEVDAATLNALERTIATAQQSSGATTTTTTTAG